MLNFIPTTISNKFTPGSPECIVSIESAVNLRISAAFLKAFVGSIFPAAFHGRYPAISHDGRDFSYRGAIDSRTGMPFGRGVVYEGSLLSPKTFEMGLFTENRELKEGYRYLKNDLWIGYIGSGKESVTVNIVTSNGEYVRGVFPKPQNMKTPIYSLPTPLFSKERNGGLPLPIHGGEIYGTSEGGAVYGGTFQPDGTFTGRRSLPNGGPFMEGVFSFKELPNGLISCEQISGIHEETVNEITFTTKIPLGRDQFEGRATFPNGSFREGIFRLKNESNESTQLSGTFELKNEDGSIYKGKILGKDTFEGRMSFPNGSFSEGVFSTNLSHVNPGFFGPQLSGTFKEILGNGFILEGTLEREGKGTAKYTLPGKHYTKVTIDISKGDLGFVVKEKGFEYKNGAIFKIELDQEQSAILTYPNGDYKKGIFAGDPLEGIPSLKSGEERTTLSDGSVLTGEFDGWVFRGMKTNPDGTQEYVIV